MLVVKFALEALVHMVDAAKARLEQLLAGLERAFSAATNQDNRCAGPLRRANSTAEQQLAYLGDEVRIHDPIRLVDPGNMYGALGVADEQELHRRADIDQDRLRIVFGQLQCLLRRQAFRKLFGHLVVPCVLYGVGAAGIATPAGR